MAKFVMFEVWTRWRMVEAESQDAALEAHEPVLAPAPADLNLANWYAVPVDDAPIAKDSAARCRPVLVGRRVETTDEA